MMGRTLAVRLMRGGTSKGVFICESDLSHYVDLLDRCATDLFISKLMGSDPSGMQLDGLGGSVSSTSKVVLMKRSETMPGTVDYRFGQVALKTTKVDWEASCGNLAAAAGLFAWEEGLVQADEMISSHFSRFHSVVKMWQANARYLMHIHIPIKEPVPRDQWISIAGVPGKSPPVLVEILNPIDGQPYKMFPTGRIVDNLQFSNGRHIDATLLRATNPTVFVRACDLGLKGHELPSEVQYEDKILPEIQFLLEQAAQKMGMETATSAIRLCWVSQARDYVTTNHSTIKRGEVDVLSRITTEGRVHHAHTGTGALNLAIAASVPGTIVHEVCGGNASTNVRIGHPAGVLQAFATVNQTAFEWKVKSCGLVRTARTLITGQANLI